MPREPVTVAFRGVAGQMATAVSVVITLVGDQPVVATVSSAVAASWEPPLLLIFLQTGSRLASAIDRTQRFTVNVLRESDHALARRCARADRDQTWEALAGVPLRRRAPAPPVLQNALAWMDCAVGQSFPIGDHRGFVGEVLATARDDQAAPLLYYRGRFRGLGPAVAPPTWNLLETVDLVAAW